MAGWLACALSYIYSVCAPFTLLAGRRRRWRQQRAADFPGVSNFSLDWNFTMSARPPASWRRHSFHSAANYYANDTDFSLSPGASTTFNVVTTSTGMGQNFQQLQKMLISLWVKSLLKLIQLGSQFSIFNFCNICCGPNLRVYRTHYI